MAKRKYADDAWDRFPEILRNYMAGPPLISSVRLAARLGVPPDMVNSWRRGRARPELKYLTRIATEVAALQGVPDVDPGLLLRRMGALPDPPSPSEAVRASIRLQKLELRLADSLARIREFGRTGSAASIVAAAQKSRQWAVAVWPTWEGPTGHHMHVADRLDLRRLDGAPADVWADPCLREALRDVYATPSGAHPRWTDHDETPYERFWAIHHVAAPRSPTVPRPWPGLDSIACYAIGDDVWAHDVGALLAMVVGYGLTTTRDLAVDMEGVMESADQRRERQAIAMAAAHESIAADPSSRRVWTHHGAVTTPAQVFAPATRADRPGGVVWLRETDDHLAALTDRAAAARTAELRAELDRELPANHRVVVIDVEHFADRDLRWERAMGDVLAIVRAWVGCGILPASPSEYAAVRSRLRDERGVGDVLLDWLAEKDPLFAHTP